MDGHPWLPHCLRGDIPPAGFWKINLYVTNPPPLYLFRLVLPLFNAKGKQVFTDSILDELYQVLDMRFGGCMVPSSSSAPPLCGLWHPAQESLAEKVYLSTAEVLANPIEAANRFFAGFEADPENRRPDRAAGDLDFADRMPADVTARRARIVYVPNRQR